MTLPEIPPDCKVLSVVYCRKGYQACVQRRVEVSFYPHYKHVTIRAKGENIAKAIEAAINIKPNFHHQDLA